MKFETKFGIGEIVYYSRLGRSGAKHDEFLEVTEILICKQGVRYACRWPTGLVGLYLEEELEGDPDYDHDLGRYPTESFGKLG